MFKENNRIDTPVYKKLIINQYIYHTSIILFHKAITKSNKSIMNIVDKISSRQCLLEVFPSSFKLYQSRKVKAKKKLKLDNIVIPKVVWSSNKEL